MKHGTDLFLLFLSSGYAKTANRLSSYLTHWNYSLSVGIKLSFVIYNEKVNEWRIKMKIPVLGDDMRTR